MDARRAPQGVSLLIRRMSSRTPVRFWACPVDREISSANRPETLLDATAGSCQAERRGTPLLLPPPPSLHLPPTQALESGPVPTDHRLRFENFQGIQHARHKTIQPSKHQAIDALEGRSFGRFALQDVELMAQNKDLCPQAVPSIGRAWSAHMPAT